MGRSLGMVGATVVLVLASCEATVEGGGTHDAGADASTPPRDGSAPTAEAGGDAVAPGDAAPDALAAPDAAAEAGPADTGAPDGGPGPDPCAEIAGASFATLSIAGPPSDRPPPEHGDLNLELRGWEPTGGALGLVDIDGPTDDLAPRIPSLFADDRVPAFVENFAVRQWDWGCNCRAGAITSPEVTLIAVGTAAGEVLEAPRSGYDIGDGYDVLVLYVADETVTLKYTRDDNVVAGYTVHLHGVCVDPRLRALYDASDRAGRGELPALRGDQPFARARGAAVLVAIRDTGSFMDPRSRKDWW